MSPLQTELLLILDRADTPRDTRSLAAATTSLVSEVRSALDGLQIDELVSRMDRPGDALYVITVAGRRVVGQGVGAAVTLQCTDLALAPGAAAAATSPGRAIAQPAESTTLAGLSTRARLLEALRGGPLTNGEISQRLQISTAGTTQKARPSAALAGPRTHGHCGAGATGIPFRRPRHSPARPEVRGARSPRPARRSNDRRRPGRNPHRPARGDLK